MISRPEGGKLAIALVALAAASIAPVVAPLAARALPPAPSGLIQLADPNECVGDATVQPACAAAIGLSSGSTIVSAGDGAVSPDGKNVYVAVETILLDGTLTGGVLSFQRSTQPGPALGSLAQLPAPDGCLARDADGPGPGPPDISGCTGVQWPEGQPNDAAVSPDGKNVYVTADGGSPPGAVLMYSRSTTPGPSLGALSYIDCVSNFGDGGCAAAASGLVGPFGIDVSPDGRNVYVAGYRGSLGSVVALDRSVSAGTLTYANCVTETTSFEPGCSHAGHGLVGPNDVQVSPDGNNVYTSSNDGFDGAVAAFGRDLTPNTPFGEITQLAGQSGCVSETGIDHQGGTPNQCVDGRGLDSPGGLGISPDGHDIYVSAANSTLATIDRNVGTGGLSQASSTSACLSNDADGSGPLPPDDPECSGVERFEGPGDVEIGPDGKSVYAALGIQGKGGVRALDRDPASGALTPLAGADGCIDDASFASACTDGEGIGSFVQRLLIDPAGTSLYMTSFSLVGGAGPSAVAEFVRGEVVPSCSGASVSTAVGSPTTVHLDCSDANGDPFSRAIVSAPASGSLGPVDETGGTVSYTPNAAFSGTDSFTFKANDGFGDSAVATVSVTGPAPLNSGLTDDIAPSISGLKIKPKRFAVDRRGAAVAKKKKKKRRGGAKIQYALAKPASVSFTIERKTTGRKAKGTCREATQKARGKRRCTRYTAAGKFSNSAAVAGANKQRFSGKIGKRKLGRGAYRLTAIATDAAGHTSKPAKTSFKVIRR